MGNHSSSGNKRKSVDVNGHRKPSTDSKETRHNDEDVTTAKPGEFNDQQRRLNTRMYRSNSQSDQSDRSENKPDFRLHRHSFIAGGHTPAAASDGRQRRTSETGTGKTDNSGASRTLPRSFGRSRSTVATPTSSADTNHNGVVMRQRQCTPVKAKRRPTSDYSTADIRTIHKTRPLSSLGAVEDGQVEFPDSATIQRRTDAFQRRFVEHFVTVYSCLSTHVQTSALSVAVRRHPINHAQLSPVISLSQYLSETDASADALFQLPDADFALTVTADCFDLIQRARVDRSADRAALARHIVSDVAAEAAVELARAFEYQLVLLGDEEGLPARLAAQRAAERVVNYLQQTGRQVDVNSLVTGVVHGRPADVAPSVSVVVGPHRELRWNIDDMFQRAGLRRERLLVAGAIDAIGGYGTPWRFYSTPDGTDATLYGYRGQLVMRDFYSSTLTSITNQRLYRLNADEEAAYSVEVPCRSNDFHRTYRPYRRLVGSAVMARYTALPDDDKLTRNLPKYVQQLQGEAFHRDDVEPVFRQLSCDFRQYESVPRSSPIHDCYPPKQGTSGVDYACNGVPDVQQVRLTTGKQRTPPAVKPKPIPDVRRQSSAIISASRVHDGLELATTPTSVKQRQKSVAGDGQDFASPAVVRFPTLEELFGRELAAASRNPSASNDICSSSTSGYQDDGSTTRISPLERNGVVNGDTLLHKPARLLVSDI